MRNDPTLEELRQRVNEADEGACNGGWQDSNCPWCRDVLEILRGGCYCPECGHINALGHDCDDWDCEHGTKHDEWEQLVPRRFCKFVGTNKTEGGNLPPIATSNPSRIWVASQAVPQ